MTQDRKIGEPKRLVVYLEDRDLGTVDVIEILGDAMCLALADLPPRAQRRLIAVHIAALRAAGIIE